MLLRLNGWRTAASGIRLNLLPGLLAIACIALALTACGPANPAAQPTNEPTVAAEEGTPTSVPTLPASLVPVATQGPPTATAGGAGMPSACPAAVTELKYRLFEKFGKNIMYCDGDYWPLVRDEGAAAQKWYAAADKRSDEFQTILKGNKLDPASKLTAEQILTLYRDFKRLQVVVIAPQGEKCTFQIAVAPGAVNPPGGEGAGKKYEGYFAEDGSIQVTKEEAYGPVPCPICLAGNTLIDTPDGPVAVRDLREGMAVWTANASGARQAETVVRTSRTKVPSDHRVVHLVLADGRELLASPGHPAADGRQIGALATGDSIDGARVVKSELVPYEEEFTYDLLPSGDTGTYWANGILVGSTLGGGGIGR